MTPTRVALRLVAAGLVCGAAVPLYVFLVRPVGYAMLAVGLLVAATVDRHLLRHLALITASLVVISTVSLAADLSNAGIARFAIVLSLACSSRGASCGTSSTKTSSGSRGARASGGAGSSTPT